MRISKTPTIHSTRQKSLHKKGKNKCGDDIKPEIASSMNLGKIESLKKMIENGEYSINKNGIATAILRLNNEK